MPMILYISRIANFVQRIRWFVNANLYIFFNFYIVNILDNNFTKLDKEQHVIKNFSLMHSKSIVGLFAIGLTEILTFPQIFFIIWSVIEPMIAVGITFV